MLSYYAASVAWSLFGMTAGAGLPGTIRALLQHSPDEDDVDDDEGELIPIQIVNTRKNNRVLQHTR